MTQDVQEALQRQYKQGLTDGGLMLLDHLEARPEAQGEPYRGPIPDELRDWLAGVRERMAA